MKVVAVSQRVAGHPDRNEQRDALDQQMTPWLRSASCLPFPVPNTLPTAEEIRAWLDNISPAGLVLSGGGNIGEAPQRDFTEEIMLQYAKRHRLPLLGICRGMQMLARWHLAELKPVAGHVRTRHRLSGEIEGEANSFHQFALVECPLEFRVLARSEDGGIEAIRHKTLPWEGWMWHPEREPEFAVRDIERLKALFA